MAGAQASPAGAVPQSSVRRRAASEAAGAGATGAFGSGGRIRLLLLPTGACIDVRSHRHRLHVRGFCSAPDLVVAQDGASAGRSTMSAPPPLQPAPIMTSSSVQPQQSQTWFQRHWKGVVVTILVLVVASVLALVAGMVGLVMRSEEYTP